MFFSVTQNNSGARYIPEKGLAGKHIIIEAGSSDEARERFEGIREAYGAGFDDYCSCCGRRWFSWFQVEDATSTPNAGADDYTHFSNGDVVKGREANSYYQTDDDEEDWD